MTDVQIRNWIKGGAAVQKADGDGLTFTLSTSGVAAWILRYRVAGKRKELTLGRYPDISLGEARRLASEARAKVQQGVDVAAEKQRAKIEDAAAWTVRQLGADYLAKAEASLAANTIKARRQQLRDYVYPVIGALRARDVSGADVVTLTERAATKSAHVARLALVVTKEVFAHGFARHAIESDPTAGVKAKAVIGPCSAPRARLMLSEAELRALLPILPQLGRANELAIKVLLATCTRIGELIRAEWSHVDFDRREWTIPPEHAKNGKRFVIPLASPAVGWFSELRKIAFESRYVLPVRARRSEGDRPMVPCTLNEACGRAADLADGRCRRFTPHDLRSTARSHLTALGVDILVAERCLNHSLGGLVAVYDQHDYLTERRAALEKWAAYLVACETGQGWNVVPLRKVSGEK